jgi:hypothetical protein
VTVEVRRSTPADFGGANTTPDGVAAFGPTLGLTVTLAVAAFLIVMSSVLLVIHPNATGLLALVVGQRQTAKSALYFAAFAVILPIALIAVPHLVDTIARGPNGRALPVLAGGLATTLIATIIAVKLSDRLPWGDGLGVVLAGVGGWGVLATAVLGMAARQTPWPHLLRVADFGFQASVTAALLLFGAVLCVTHLKSLSPLPLLLGAGAILAVLWTHGRGRLKRLGRWQGAGIDIAVIAILVLAIPDTVIFHPSAVPPSPYYEPGITQFQQDWILGPTNQLLAGGALMVNVPVSQYGVGLVYFLDGWFHLVPIGYGTFGLLDGIVTAGFYVAAYSLLRITGVTRLLAASALATGVLAFVYNLHYAVGVLPEQGPLRFGLPLPLILAVVAAQRWPHRAKVARAVGFSILALASVWAVEAFAYSAFAFIAMVVLEAWLKPHNHRFRWLAKQIGFGAAACLCAHLILAGGTLAATGQLPDWGQYLAYVHALLLGGREGSVTYGFERWSPGLALGSVCLTSAAAIVLLARRAPATFRAERIKMLALTGMTAYAIAAFSYTDNRSSTYLLPYVALPTLVVGTLWLSLLLHQRNNVSRGFRVGSLALGLAVPVLLIAAAWPSIGGRFSSSALAHAYPGGRLGTALHRLSHPPPIDPRAPEGERLLNRYIPGRRALVLLPTKPDLSIEILMRSGRANKLFIGDPNMDGFVPSNWVGEITKQIEGLRSGDRVLMDRTALAIATELHTHPLIDPITKVEDPGTKQEAWILRQLDKRFRLQPIYGDKEGFIVAELSAR